MPASPPPAAAGEDAALRAELLRLADELLAAAHADPHGLYWPAAFTTPGADPASGPLVDESLFAGGTGIALFFVALAGYSGLAAHRATAEAAAGWLVAYARRTPPANVSFFSGRTGLVYLCLKLFELTGQARHRRWAAAVARAIRPQLRRGNGSPDLLGGEAGNLLVVAYLYRLTGARGWRPVLAAGLRRLAQHAQPGRQGLKWSYHPASLDSPTGLSHGASGIAHALLELSDKVGPSPALRWLAHQALRYEAAYYRPAAGTWLSLRTPAPAPADPRTLTRAPARLLLGGGQLAGWAHGAAGFALVRQRAAPTLGLAYAAEAAAGLRRVRWHLARRPPARADYTLCAGRGGLAEVLLVSAEPAALGQARQVALAALAQRQHLGYYAAPGGGGPGGPGLLTGRAGIGYLLLRVLAPAEVASVLLPRLPPPTSQVPGWGPLPVAALRRQVWGAHFRRTLHLLAVLCPAALPTLFADAAFPSPEVPELDVLQRQLRQQIRCLPLPARAVVADAFTMERGRLALLRRPAPAVQREARQHALAAWHREPAHLHPPSLLATRFCLSPEARLLATRWPWSGPRPARWRRNLTARPGHHATLLHLVGPVVHEQPLAPLAAALLHGLRRPATGAQLAAQLGAGLPEAAVRAAVAAQLLALLAAGVILPAALATRRPKKEAGELSSPASAKLGPAGGPGG